MNSEDTILDTYHFAGCGAAFTSRRRPAAAAPGLAWALALLFTLALSGCGNERSAAKPGQALASVNGEEITVLQLNEELLRLGLSGPQQGAAGKQVLQALIDRELLESEAAEEKIERDPKVMQAIERARSLIIAQAYMQKRIGEPQLPTPAEVEDYFNKNPQFFANRKQFAMNELIFAASALTPELRAAADRARSLEEVALFLDARKVKYGRAQVTRSTADLTPQLSARLMAMPKGQLFVVKEGERAMLISIAEVRDAPVTLEIAAPQISQYLSKRRNNALAAAEIQRLRGSASIAYLNKDYAPGPEAGVGAGASKVAAPLPQAAKAAAAGAGAGDADKAALERGVAGLK